MQQVGVAACIPCNTVQQFVAGMMKVLQIAVLAAAVGSGCASSESGVPPGGGAGGSGGGGTAGAGGGCAQDCLGGECRDGACQPFVLLSDACVINSSPLTLTDDALYFNDRPTCEDSCAALPFARMPKSGGAETVVSHRFIPEIVAGRGDSVYLEVGQYDGSPDNPNGCSRVDGRFVRASDTADAVEPVTSWGVEQDTYSMTVGLAGLYVFAGGNGPARIDQIPFDGGPPQTVIAHATDSLGGGLMTNDVNLYWISQRADTLGEILSAPTVGGAVETLVAPEDVGGLDVYLLGVDANAVYYGTSDYATSTETTFTATLYRLPNGTEPPGTPLHTFDPGSGPSSLVVSGDDVCFRIFTVPAPDTIGCIPATGGDMRVIVPPQSSVGSLQGDAEALYWWGYDTEDVHGHPSIYKVAK
jgi:hypothetical protein